MSAKKTQKAEVRSVRFAQDRSRETLRRILDAAEEVFTEKGYGGTTAAEIISRAGIGHGTFWLYFHNKDDLLQYILRDMIKEIEALDWYGEENLELFPMNSPDAVENIVRGVMDVFARYATIHPLIVHASLESEEFRDTLEELNQPFLDILVRKLREHLQKGLCRDLDPDVTAFIILSMLEYSNLRLITKSVPLDYEALIHNLSIIIYHTMNHS